MDRHSPNKSEPIVYIVDDDPSVRDSLAQLMRSVQLKAQQFESAEQFLSEYRPGSPGCLVLDVRMSGMDGISLCEKLVAEEIKIPIIVISGHGDVSMRVRAMKSGVVEFLEKPCDPQKLVESIRAAIDRGGKRTAK